MGIRKRTADPGGLSAVRDLPRVSIVVPSFNQCSYLVEALQSLVSQDHPDLELIVMDGGSTDHSVGVIKGFAGHLAYWQSTPDGGQAAALRAGFERATGEILGWLNSDDVLCPGALSFVAEAFASDASLMWLYGDSLLLDSESRIVEEQYQVQVSAAELASLQVFLPQESTFFRRDLYAEVGGVDPSFTHAMDYDLWLRFAMVAPPRHFDRILGSFRVVEGQKSGDKERYSAEQARARTRYSGPLIPVPQLSAARYRLRLRLIAARVAHQHVRLVWRLPMRSLRTLTGRGTSVTRSVPRDAAVLVGYAAAALAARRAGRILIGRRRS